MAKWAAGLLLSSVLAITGTAQAAPDCKSSWGNAACPVPKTAEPLPSAKPAMATKSSTAAPKPRPEPGVVRRTMPPGSSSKATASNPNPHQTPGQVARRAMHRRSYAQNAHGQEAWQEFDAWRARSTHFYPPPGHVYGSELQTQAPAGGFGCGDTCLYREWLEQYRAWYDRYGRDYGAGRGIPPMASAADPDRPAHEDGNSRPLHRQSSMQMVPSERDRLDPWHGYDSRDGLENGY